MMPDVITSQYRLCLIAVLVMVASGCTTLRTGTAAFADHRLLIDGIPLANERHCYFAPRRLYENFWPETDASYMRPPLAMVNTTIPS
jgi:hypothetical protein